MLKSLLNAFTYTQSASVEEDVEQISLGSTNHDILGNFCRHGFKN